MKKRRDLRQEKPHVLKKRLMASLSMLLIASIMMSTTTFAWFVLSTAPEVTGIETQVGANGSLEIVLLNTDTRMDMSSIRAGLGGGSLQENKIAANNVWGNLVDLSFTEYGLGDLTLMPARLNTSDGASVMPTNLLQVPTYGYDGRIIELNLNTASAINAEGGFVYSPAEQTYGVRAIGSADNQTLQGSVLSGAKENVKMSAKKTQNDTKSVLSSNGFDLFMMLIETSYDDDNKETLLSLLNGLDDVLGNIDNTLRMGLVAFAASELADEDEFKLARTQITNTDVTLQELLSNISGVDIPGAFSGWVNRLHEMQEKVDNAIHDCNALSGGSYTEDDIKPILYTIMNKEGIYIQGKLIGAWTQPELLELVQAGGAIYVELASGSGLFADIADFSGNYNQSIDFMGAEIVMATNSTANPFYLDALWTEVEPLTPAVGESGAPAKALKATYGYALDLAFRCNAAMPDLVLQTKGVQRVYNGGENPDDVTSNSGGTQGGGSYMEFTSMDDGFTNMQRQTLMDAIRVGFIDEQGNILGIAKLNVSNSDIKGNVLRAPLYMYDFEFEPDEVSGGLLLTMSERQKTDNLITELVQNQATAVTVVVWLDGDIVDNTMVSATEATSLSGVLNLQFATSAELVPAQDGDVMSYTSDRSGLESALIDAKLTVDEGQGTYTNVSWNAFMNAYNRATFVEENEAAGHIEIDKAIKALNDASLGLENVSAEALEGKIDELRKMMGTVNDEVARYAIVDENWNYFAVGNEEHTKDEHEDWDIVKEIKSVDYLTKNVVNEKDAAGNDTTIRTTKWTDESWNALADALYQAEAEVMNPYITDDQINLALTTLEAAQKDLEFAVYFTPYEYNGNLFYKAAYAKDAEDTYGTWYDSEFNCIYADVTILKLDAYAKAVDIATMGLNSFIPSHVGYITPEVTFLKEVFTELKDVEIKGVHWSDIDTALFIELMTGAHATKMQELLDLLDTDEVLKYDTTGVQVQVDAVNELLTRYGNNEEVLASDAETAAYALQDAIVTLYETNRAKMDEADGYHRPLPDGMVFDDIEFDVPFSGTALKLKDGVSGVTTLTVKVLTEDGVVIDVTKTITIYDKANGVLFTKDGFEISNLSLSVGDSAQISAELLFSNNQVTREEIKSIRWSAENSNVASVSGGMVTALEAGTTNINVTVTTNADNYYTGELTVTVTGGVTP